ncbi:hypothetical protein EJ110_NYTH34261 [Nymphaea thermarum]|nr:hypothetical protein EJ110_NYTH34261 [Nymphaea thermarum]
MVVASATIPVATLTMEVAALSNYGFPWTKLGLLYSHDASIFDINGSLLRRRLDAIIEWGFSRMQLVGICLAFPFVLGRREEESTGEDDGLFDDLKWDLLTSRGFANTIRNLPEIMKAIGLHGWFSSKILNGGHRLLTGLDANSDKEESKSNPRSDRTPEDKLLTPSTLN